MIFLWLVEIFFGKWVCVVAQPILPIEWVVICNQHSLTKRVKGYVIMHGGKTFRLDPAVALEHFKKYSAS